MMDLEDVLVILEDNAKAMDLCMEKLTEEAYVFRDGYGTYRPQEAEVFIKRFPDYLSMLQVIRRDLLNLYRDVEEAATKTA